MSSLRTCIEVISSERFVLNLRNSRPLRDQALTVWPLATKILSRSSSPPPSSTRATPRSMLPLKTVLTSPFFMPKQCTVPAPSPITTFCVLLALFLLNGSTRRQPRLVVSTFSRSTRDIERSISAGPVDPGRARGADQRRQL